VLRQRVGSLTKQSTMKPMKPMSGMKPMKPMEPLQAPVRWWPKDQNEMRYAFFGDQQRLAVDTGDGKVQVYETEDHRISGVQQHQSSRRRELLARQFVRLALTPVAVKVYSVYREDGQCIV
jgi:hypothetical protein